MRVKRFVAPSIQEAVEDVRCEFGPDAVIMRTARVRQPGVFGLFRPTWVAVTAGLDEEAEQTENGHAQAEERSATTSVPAPFPLLSNSEPKTSVSQVKLNDLAVAHLLERLRQQEVAEEYLGELGDTLHQRLTERGGEVPLRHLLALLADHFATAPWVVGTDTPLVVPLVGPTGVGKTTTVAKLAATYALVKGYRVGLVTADTYRVAAVEQLRTYADILGLPLEVVYSPQEMAPALQRLQDRQLVLVDTAGRSPHHEGQMQELQAFLSETGSSAVHLTVSATTRHIDMIEIADAFASSVTLAGLVITKLDETRCYGMLYNLVRRTGKPIAFVTNGQGVPEDLVAADGEQLARLLLGVDQ